VVKDDDSPVALIQSEGTPGALERTAVDRLARSRQQHGLRDSFPAVLLINNDMTITNIQERSTTTVAQEILQYATSQNVLVVRTIDLLFLVNHLEKSSNKKSRLLHILTSDGGWLKATSGGYDILHP